MSAARKGSPLVRWGRRKVVEVFGADLRSLAVLRVVLAGLVLADLLGRGADLYAHYTDRGVLPRGALLQEATNRWQISLNLMSGELLVQVLLFDAAALAALTLLIGYRTRLMTVVLWVLVLSIQARNPLVLNTGDTLLRMLLFWAMFLPLGAYWSVDRALMAAPPRISTRFLSFATAGLLLQIAFVYWFSAIQKSGEEWRVDGTAVYYALSVGAWTTPIGAYLYQFPTLLTALTFATILLEAFGPFLLFFPLLTGPVRTGAILAFMSLHLGIWLTMPIGLFSGIAALCMVCFLPGWFWDKVVPRLGTRLPERATEAARRLARRLKRVGESGAARLIQASSRLSLQARPSSAASARERHSAAPAEDDGVAVGFEPSSQPSTEPPMLRSSLVTNLLALFFLLYVFCWNLTTVSEFAMPERARPLGYLLGLRQDWGVFAPSPTRTDGWYIIPGTLRSGQQVDLMGAAVRNDFELREGVSWEEPENIGETFKNKYWRKYLGTIRDPDKKDLRKYFGRYVCREWNARHTGGQQLMDLQIVYMKVKTLPDYQRTPPEKVVLREHSCS